MVATISSDAYTVDRGRDLIGRSDLDGKVCLIVGGGSIAPGWGIGRAVAVAYARVGAKVVVCDQNAESAGQTLDIIEEDGGSAFALEADATDPASIGGAVAAATERFGSLDVLHNNVGIGKAGPSENVSVEEWRRIADANLLALHVSAQAAIPAMKRRGGGVILTTSSIASLRFLGFAHLAYSVTKAAANHFSRGIAVEYAGDGIRSNSIIAGLLDTPRIRVTLKSSAYEGDEETMKRKRAAQVPLGFMGDAWDIAHASVFLASDCARYITGAEIVVDGALSATVRT